MTADDISDKLTEVVSELTELEKTVAIVSLIISITGSDKKEQELFLEQLITAVKIGYLLNNQEEN